MKFGSSVNDIEGKGQVLGRFLENWSRDYQVFSLKKEMTFDSLSFWWPFERNPHSQTTITFQPRSLSNLSFFLSRFLLPSILAIQYAWFDVGIRKRGQLCPCQKQPRTCMTVFRLGRTMSGEPGKSRLCSLKRKPALWSACRTVISGRVFLLFTLAIISLRFDCETVSVMTTG